jgi:hypothetical protein
VVEDANAITIATNAGVAATTLNEAIPTAAYSDDAKTACCDTDVIVPTTPTHADTCAPATNSREETYIREETEQDRITT